MILLDYRSYAYASIFCTIRWLRGCKVVNGITGQTCLNCFNWQFNLYKGLAGSGQCRARRQC